MNTPKDLVSFPELLLRTCHSPCQLVQWRNISSPECSAFVVTWHCCMAFADRRKKRMFSGGSVQVWGQRIYSGHFACWLILSCSHVIPEKQLLCCSLPCHSFQGPNSAHVLQLSQCNEHRASLHLGNIFYPRRDFRTNTKNYLAGLFFFFYRKCWPPEVHLFMKLHQLWGKLCQEKNMRNWKRKSERVWKQNDLRTICLLPETLIIQAQTLYLNQAKFGPDPGSCYSM